jgi:glycerophosphoryl diester phosphodiesterase
MQKQIIIAHRGESFKAPENTISSINLAWEKGADAIEIDVRLTKDNQIVVIHDSHTKRVSGKYKRISKSNLEELRNLDVGKYKNSKYTGEKIPTLQEVLKTVTEGKKILIEIKSHRKVVPFLKELIDNSGLQKNQIEIISFNLKTLIKVKRQIPYCEVFWVSAFNYCNICRFLKMPLNTIINKAIKYNLNGLDLLAHGILDAEKVKKIKSAGLKLYVWTVNDPEKARYLLNAGVDGITTDRAKWIKDQLEIMNK